jgi:hypothetical protein
MLLIVFQPRPFSELLLDVLLVETIVTTDGLVPAVEDGGVMGLPTGGLSDCNLVEEIVSNDGLVAAVADCGWIMELEGLVFA